MTNDQPCPHYRYRDLAETHFDRECLDCGRKRTCGR